jgi:Protein of unknown function (DUF3987)/Bifunctional DNA primase/polymerase, N-terminal
MNTTTITKTTDTAKVIELHAPSCLHGRSRRAACGECQAEDRLTITSAQGLHRRGFRVIPLPRGSKNPGVNGWQHLQYTAEQIPVAFADGHNIGLLLGSEVDVDGDCPEAVAAAKVFLPKTGMRHGRPGNPDSHYWYRPAQSMETQQYEFNGRMLVELRASGQTVVPPSLHPNGERIAWVADGEPAAVDPETLRTAVGRVAACALLAQEWPKEEGIRHKLALALSGCLLNKGLPREMVSTLVSTAARIAGDDEGKDRLTAAATTEANRQNGKPITGGTTVLQLVPGWGPVLDKISEWLGVDLQEAPWPEPQSIPDQLLPVEAYEAALMPAPLREWVTDIVDRMPCPPEFPATCAICALSILIGRKVGIRPKRYSDWVVVPNLWGMNIGSSGILKTPPLNEVLKPVRRLSVKAAEAHKGEMEVFRIVSQAKKARREGLLDKLKGQYKLSSSPEREQTIEGIKAELLDLGEDRPPTEKRYVTNDATVARLAELLQENPNGLLLFRDELKGLLNSMEQQGHESDRDFYNEAWNGDGSADVDRIGRGHVHVDHLCLAIFGGIQPGPLSAYLRGAFSDAESDGFIQRFQLAVYPDPLREWRNTDRWANPSVKEGVFRLFEAIDRSGSLEFGTPEEHGPGLPTLRFSPEAQALFDRWLERLERRLLAADEHPVLISHLSKYRSLFPSLALIFHVVMELTDKKTPVGDVSLEATTLAEGWCVWLEQHARRIYHSLTSVAETSAALIGAHLTRGHLSSPFNVRDIQRKGWAGLGDKREITAGLEYLEDLGWLRSERVAAARRASGLYSGRETTVWAINPALAGKR